MKTVISESIIKLLFKRITLEEHSSRLYLSMSIWLGFNGFTGAAKLWKKYSDEETLHAEWAYKFLADLDIKAPIQVIAEQPDVFNGFVDIIDKSYKHEVFITETINELGAQAMKEGDFLTMQLVMKYQNEQVEELAETVYWLDRLEAFGDSDQCLRMLDNEMRSKS